MKISLTLAAKIISEESGYPISRSSLRNQIVRGRWPYKQYLPDPKITRKRLLLVELDDALAYAKNFSGIKKGRPWFIDTDLDNSINEMCRIAGI